MIYVNAKLESKKLEHLGRFPDMLEIGGIEYRALTPDRFSVIIESLRYSGATPEQAANVTKIEELLRESDNRAAYYVAAGMVPV